MGGIEEKTAKKGCVVMPLGITITIPMEKPKHKKNSKLRYYLFCIKWLWNNREWENTRQKFKAMERAYKAVIK